MDAPTDTNLAAYVEQLKKFEVGVVVRACEPTYSSVPLKQNGIDVLELPFPDGDPPPNEVVDQWLDLVQKTFESPGKTIAVHCVAGLGRAPVLVAIALIEKGMDPYDAIEFIRQKRRGAINSRQVTFLSQYRRRRGQSCFCVIQ